MFLLRFLLRVVGLAAAAIALFNTMVTAYFDKTTVMADLKIFIGESSMTCRHAERKRRNCEIPKYRNVTRYYTHIHAPTTLDTTA